MLSPKLETERLLLRRYNESDIDVFYEILHHDRLHKYILFPNLTVEQELEYIRNCMKDVEDGCIPNRRLNKDGTYSGVDFYSKTK